MKEAGKNRHIVDLLLPIALFLVLAASSLFLVLLAANVYQKNVAWEERNYESRTCLSYVTEKIPGSFSRKKYSGTIEYKHCSSSAKYPAKYTAKYGQSNLC